MKTLVTAPKRQKPIAPVTDDEILDFVMGDTADAPPKNNPLTSRVLLAALMQSDVPEKLMVLRDAEADYLHELGARSENAAAAASQKSLEKSLLHLTRTFAGFAYGGDFDASDFDASDTLGTPAEEVTALRNAGGGRYVTRTAQSLGDALQSAIGAAQAAHTLILAHAPVLRLPCLAPALAADLPSYDAFAPVQKEIITTGDGVRIEFQQLPGSGNRLRVLVDTSRLPAPTSEDAERAYNVAFLTLTEGDSAPAATTTASHGERHILVVSLNTKGVGFADFAVSSLPIGDAAPNKLPAPRNGGCRLVSATLSYLPAA